MMMNLPETTKIKQEMTFSDLEAMVNQILIKAYQQGLTDLQGHILKGFYEGKTSTEMTTDRYTSVRTIDNESSKLYKLLNESQLLSESVNKGNLISVLKRYKGSQENDNNYRATENQNIAKKVPFSMMGNISEDEVQLLKEIVKGLQQRGNDITISIADLKKGSLQLILNGSQEGLQKIENLFKEGKLNEIIGVPVENVEFTEDNYLAFTIKGQVDDDDISYLKFALISQDLIETEQEEIEANLLEENKIDNKSNTDLREVDLRDARAKNTRFTHSKDSTLKREPETKFLQLTNKTLKVGSTFYKTDNITRVSVHTVKPTYSVSIPWMLGSWLIGIVLVFIGASGNIGGMQFFGVLIFSIGVAGIIERFSKKNKYALFLETNGGSKSLVSSPDRGFIEEIVGKIYDAMNHSDPSANYTFNMEDRSVTIGRNVYSAYIDKEHDYQNNSSELEKNVIDRDSEEK